MVQYFVFAFEQFRLRPGKAPFAQSIRLKGSGNAVIWPGGFVYAPVWLFEEGIGR